MWKKFRFGIRFLIAFIRRYFALIILGTIISIISIWASPKLNNIIPKFRPTNTIGIIGSYDHNNLPTEILNHVSLGLTQINEQGEAYQGLSSSWVVEENGKVWKFNLDPQLTWSNNHQINSTDIQLNFKDVTTEYPSDNQIKFTLQDPFSPFPTVLSKPILNSNFTGIGPYKFTKINQIGSNLKSILLVPVNKSSTLPNLKYNFYGTEEAAKTALKLGEIHQINNILKPDEFKSWPKIKITINPQMNKYVGLFFNLDHPNFSEKSSRQALGYAISDKSFSNTRILSPIMPESWAYNPHIKPYEYDLERAKSLWGDFKIDPDDPIQISTVPSLLPIAEKIVIDWEKFEIPTEIKVINAIPEDFQILLVTQEVPYDPDQYVLWHSTQPTNITNYQNPKIDKLLEDGRKTLDKETRLEIYEEFQRTLLEDLPVIYLYRPVTHTITRS